MSHLYSIRPFKRYRRKTGPPEAETDNTSLRWPQKRIVTYVMCHLLDLGLNQPFLIESATYFTTRPVPAELPAARLVIRDVTSGVDQQMAALCVAVFYFFSMFPNFKSRNQYRQHFLMKK